MLNRPSETPVAIADEAPRLHPVPVLGALRAAAAESRPMLESGRHGVARAETQVTLARRELWPDPVIGVAYGGMISSPVLMLIVIPAIYSLWREWQLRRGRNEAVPAEPALAARAAAASVA